ncbi:hypothetical protein [Lentzea sp. NPDC059081]|uniref:hypothetical protein n=1 Tax=Lentzea sp. NPDC059081 TaxID=3346719 RepID=UPI00367FCF4B
MGARTTAPEAGFHVRALGELPWDDGTFDVVTAFDALFFAHDRAGSARTERAQAREDP